MENFVAPGWNLDAFNCPHCGAYAHQKRVMTNFDFTQSDHCFRPNYIIGSMTCRRCKKFTLWITDYILDYFDSQTQPVCVSTANSISEDEHDISPHFKMIYPDYSSAPQPNPDMPDDVKVIYLEASLIADRSPRSAAALLRLALQLLCRHLGCPGDNINNDIRQLVMQGLSPLVQKALDTVRIIGNNAVHPGQINIDDGDTVPRLFVFLNLIIEQMITVPNHVDQMFDGLSQGQKAQIAKRDGMQVVP